MEIIGPNDYVAVTPNAPPGDSQAEDRPEFDVNSVVGGAVGSLLGVVAVGGYTLYLLVTFKVRWWRQVTSFRRLTFGVVSEPI